MSCGKIRQHAESLDDALLMLQKVLCHTHAAQLGVVALALCNVCVEIYEKSG